MLSFNAGPTLAFIALHKAGSRFAMRNRPMDKRIIVNE
jgi:hypothetical protein